MNPRRCLDLGVGRLLAAYELGLLDEQERARFEAHAGECDWCSEELYRAAPFVTALRAQPGAALGILEIDDRKATARPRGSLRVRALESLVGSRLFGAMRAGAGWRRMVPAAAVAAIVLAIVLWPRPSDRGDYRALARLEPIPYVPIETRGGSGGAIALFRDGMALYSKSRYREAAQRLGEAIRAGEASDTTLDLDQARLFLGVSRLLLGEPEAAIAPLEAAARSSLEPVSDRAAWYLAQAHLLRGDPRSAEALLTSLAENSPAYRREASRQLDRLRALRPSVPR